MKKILLMSALFLASTAGWAADYVLRISNNIGVDVHQVYVSHEKSQDWEDDILDEDEILASGENFKLTLNDYPSPWFDVLVVDADGQKYAKYEVNVEETDVNFTSKDLTTEE